MKDEFVIVYYLGCNCGTNLIWMELCSTPHIKPMQYTRWCKAVSETAPIQKILDSALQLDYWWPVQYHMV